VPAGRREVQVQMVGYLPYRALDIEVRADQVATMPDIELLAGDINGDEVINLFDLVAVSSRYGAAGPAYAEDVNGDGQVNLFDLVLVGSNYGTSA
jgi:hypothetical protein